MPPSNRSKVIPETVPSAPRSIMHLLSTKQLIAVGAALIVVLTGVALFAGRSAPVSDYSTSTPKKVGIANFRQGESSVEGLKKGLADLGYTNVSYIQKEITIGPSMMGDIKNEFTRMIQEDHVDVIFADHEQQAQVAIETTAALHDTTPIVYLARFHDPVEMGLAASYKSSGNNATGVAQNLAETVSHNLQFIKEITPGAKKIGIFGNGFVIPGVGDRYFTEFKQQAEQQGFQVIEYKTTAAPPGAEKAWNDIAATIKPGDLDAIFHVPGHFYEPQEKAEYGLAKSLKIPHSVPVEDMPGGGDFSYSADFRSAGEQAARIVDKIFRGQKPSDIPVEYGEKSILILNQFRAKESGLTFPDSMLYLADQIISTSTAE